MTSDALQCQCNIPILSFAVPAACGLLYKLVVQACVQVKFCYSSQLLALQQRVAVTTMCTSSQGYYRRGEAHFALGKYKAALKDFKSAARLAPKDPDCRRKLASCEKEVKRIRFEEALATPVSLLILHA